MLQNFFFADNATTSYANCSNGEVRLMGGANATLGVVQVCMNNAWGSVCRNGFGFNDATVVCRQLGFPTTGALALIDTSMFGSTTGPVFLDQVACAEEDNVLAQCPISGIRVFGQTECDLTELAGVQCIGKVLYSISSILLAPQLLFLFNVLLVKI